MPIRPVITSTFVLCAALAPLAQRPACAADATDPPPLSAAEWRFTLGVGTTIPVGKEPHLPPVPGIGARFAVERGWLGAVASAELMLAECVNGVEPDQACGEFRLWGIGPQATLRPRRPWSPYATALFQVGHGERHAFGLPSFMRPTGDRNCDFGCARWWFWQTSAGVTFSFD
jgi:hypothetical protein